jgi:hypothetical protein
MGNNLKTISLSITSVALTFLISATAFSAQVDISYQAPGTSTTLDITEGEGKNKIDGTVNAGLNEITINGNSSLALNTSNNSMAGTWTATATSYADIQAGAGQYNSGRKGEEEYSKAGYLFSLLDISESLSSTAAKYNALVNYVIWDILDDAPDLDNKDDEKAVKALKKSADGNKKFDWSTTMVVYTANDGSAREFFTVLPPIATPIPSALFLFGSMALGLFGIATRKQAPSA